VTRRGMFALGAAASVALATYGSLVPLRWREASERTWERIRTLPLEPFAVTRSGDLVVNVLVMLPVGFFVAGLASQDRRISRPAAVWIISAVAGLAMALEVGQLFVRDRTASWSDVAGLTLGGVGGLGLWIIAGQRLLERGMKLTTASCATRLQLITVFYSVAWVLVSALPLVFPRYAYPLVRSVWLRTAPPYETSEAAAELALDVLAVAPIGAGLLLLARRFTLHVPARVGLATTAVLVIMGLDTIRQVTPIIGTPPLWTRLAGLSLGALGAARAAAGHALSRRVAWCSLALWSVLLVIVTWAPFDFGVPVEVLDQRVRVLYERAPLARYYWAPPLVALDMALTMVSLAVPVGALLTVLAGGARRRRTTLVVGAGTVLFALLEWGQLYLPARRADPTDVGLAAVGVLIGAGLARFLAASPRRPLADS
jgi:VanZ family protein